MVAHDNSGTPTSTTTRYYYDDQRVLLETKWDSSGPTETDLRYFVYGNYIDEVLMMVDITADPDKDYYYAHDHLYSVAAVFGPNGGLLWGERYEYDAYGEVSIMSGTTYAARSASNIGNPYTFTGRRLDSLDPDGSGGYQLKLMYYRARTYDPQTGRFMQRDPLGINPAGGKQNLFMPTVQYDDGLNIYDYSNNNPVLQTDPLGLESGACGVMTSTFQEGIGNLVDEIVEIALEKGYDALRLRFSDIAETYNFGEASCKPGRVKYLKFTLTIQTVTKFRTFQPLRSIDRKFNLFVWTRTFNYYACSCPCKGNYKWQKTIYEADDESGSNWDEIYRDITGHRMFIKTYNIGRAVELDCVYKLSPIMKFLCN